MSEPTIKPVYMCRTCGPCWKEHTDEFVQSFKHLHEVTTFYTHDDLVAAVARFQAHDRGFDFNPEMTSYAQEFVERLTGVKR